MSFVFPVKNNVDKVRDIVVNKITHINGDVDPVGWLGEVVMSQVNFHPNKAQISLGKMLASTLKEISRLTCEVPDFVVGVGVKEDEAKNFAENMQIIGTDVPIVTRYYYPALSAFVTEKTMKFFENKKKDRRIRLNADYFLELAEMAAKEVPLQDEITYIYVDLCLLKNGHTALELKSTADEDTSGARQTLMERIMIPYIVIPDNRDVFLGIITNNKGLKKNGEWAGHLGGWLSDDNILIEEDLWSVVAPKDVSFEEYKEIIKARFNELASKKKVG